MKLAAHQTMAKKKTVKKSARPKAAKKRPAKKVARQASATVTTPAAPTEETFLADLEAVPPNGVVAADLVDAMPAEPGAQREVEQVVVEVAAGLPAVEAQAGGLGELAVLRELIWLIGPARRPRSAIVGRALSDGAAISETAGMTYLRITERIRVSGLHHLREEIRAALATYDAAPARHARTLAGLLESAVRYLGEMMVVQLGRRQGMYLIGDGPVIFEGWPEWERWDEEPRALGRPGRGDAQPPAAPSPSIPPLGAASTRRIIPAPAAPATPAPPARPEEQAVPRRILRLDDPPADTSGGSSGAGP